MLLAASCLPRCPSDELAPVLQVDLPFKIKDVDAECPSVEAAEVLMKAFAAAGYEVKPGKERPGVNGGFMWKRTVQRPNGDPVDLDLCIGGQKVSMRC